MTKQILVTGGAGFIGSHLVDALVEQGHSVTVYDNLEEQVHGTEKPAYLNKDARYIWANILDYDKFKQAVVDVEVIFHKAAVVGVGQSQYQIRRYVESNTLGTAILLDILANHAHRCTKLMVAASMSSYGEGLYLCPNHGQTRPLLRTNDQLASGDWELYCPTCSSHLNPIPTPETAELHCNSFYALTKKDQEEMVLLFGKTYDLPVVALRYFNVYGPRQSLSNPYTGVAAIFMSRLKNQQSPVVFEDGGQTRDFVSVHDIVQANIIAMDSDNANGQVFNVGSGTSLSIHQVARQLAVLYDKPIEPLITRQFRKGDVRHCIADIHKIQSTLGYEPKIDFVAGMTELIDWSNDIKAVDKFELAVTELADHKLASTSR